MKKLIVTVAVMAAVAVTADTRVEFRDCPKCDKRIRIDLAAGKAYVNLSRLEGASRDEVAARAARILDAAKIPPARDPKLRPLMGCAAAIPAAIASVSIPNISPAAVAARLFRTICAPGRCTLA